MKIEFFVFRNGVSLKTMIGDSSDVIDHMVALWNETTLTILLSHYELQNIFSADEFRLFCLCLQTMIYQLS